MAPGQHYRMHFVPNPISIVNNKMLWGDFCSFADVLCMYMYEWLLITISIFLYIYKLICDLVNQRQFIQFNLNKPVLNYFWEISPLDGTVT